MSVALSTPSRGIQFGSAADPILYGTVSFSPAKNPLSSPSKARETAYWKSSDVGTPRAKKVRINSQGDRFIPNRNESRFSTSKLEDLADSDEAQNDTLTSRGYRTCVAEACGVSVNTRILEFQPAAPTSKKPVDLRSQYVHTAPVVTAQNRRTDIPSMPERVLDAPGILDDYYLNLLDWSFGNQVAVALEQDVFVWNANTGSVTNLMEATAGSYVSSVKWSPDGAYLGVGLSDGDVQIWDAEKQVKLRSMKGHTSRVGVLSWNDNMLSSGCRDGSIWNHDVSISSHKVNELLNHTAEVCGLEWRSDGAQLASGGNDNVVNIWDARSVTPRFTKTNHKAAVKALAWCPWQTNLLATGGGSQDQHIHFWNSTMGTRVNSIDTKSQVTSLKWAPIHKELISTHGHPNNTMAIWSYPNMTKTAEIIAHDSRVLTSALSPDGSSLATCASDENLKLWKICESKGRKPKRAVSSIESSKDVSSMFMMIR